MLVAQLSDLHLDGTAATRDRVRRVVTDLSTALTPPDLVLVTGDIVESSAFTASDQAAKLAEYLFVHDLLSPFGKAAYCPGNSDDDTFDFFLGEIGREAEDANQRLEMDGLTFLFLDTRVTGEMGGHIGDTTLNWLQHQLADAIRPVILVLHHPPVAYGHSIIDSVMLDNPSALEAVIQHFPQVIGLLCGHTHTPVVSQFAARPVFVAPAVHSTGRLPWAPEDSGPLIDQNRPGGWVMHRIDGTVITSIPVMTFSTASGET